MDNVRTLVQTVLTRTSCSHGWCTATEFSWMLNSLLSENDVLLNIPYSIFFYNYIVPLVVIVIFATTFTIVYSMIEGTSPHRSIVTLIIIIPITIFDVLLLFILICFIILYVVLFIYGLIICIHI
ncbi:predicted protein [Arabidopsis lyrata subsp. lyrata]|uniref:Predicted protein n=1 Tax=Arabidopsis lyrata subsp. lyrata TaxID=81972 RepID=D7KLZ7_ARALL|nr:predicted protein [Arabidopsis lyrata subsp. lyrata]